MSDNHPEIVIIRRGGHGGHDEHHGGVWKIAFADFMTAMMAFFLVLWLISANDKTRASVARYFNPVRLVDATTQPRGLHDTKKDDSGITASPDTKDKNTDANAKADNDKKGAPAGPAETAKGREKRLDSELRDNPYVALAEIVGDKGPGDTGVKTTAASDPAIGNGGAAFRDPFAPPPASTSQTADDTQDDLMLPPKPTTSASAAPRDDSETQDKRHDAAADAPKSPTESDKSLAAAVTSLSGDHSGPAIDIRKTSEGTLLSLTDTDKFAMFSNGSAVPSRRVVLMMGKIAQLLRDKAGVIVIRGFTDSRKFRSGRYDNWHLSLDRAQVAHYMLVRGGLDDARFSHVEGYADHGSAPGAGADSPRNRRIEILLKDKAT